MADKHVSLLVKEKNVDKFKVVFSVLQKKNQGIQLPAPKVGKLGKDYLISLKFDSSFHRAAIEILIFNDMKILLPDEDTKEIIDAITERRIQAAIQSSVSGDDTPVVQKVSVDSVHEMVETGNYDSIINVSKDINSDKEVIEKAINNINTSVNRAIDIAVTEASSGKALIKHSVKKLLEISEDQKIKSLNKIDLLKRAGIEAVEICGADRDSIKELINIANNNKIHNLINIKAAVKFFEVALSNRVKYKSEIEAAVKKMNVRWLTIALDVVENHVSDEEKDKLERLFTFIKQKR